MGCTQCQMSGMEGFVNYGRNSVDEGFKDEKPYECQQQKEQKCFYTTQGEMVCKAENKETKSSVLGYGLVDKYAETPQGVEHFSNLKEKFMRGGIMPNYQ